MGWGIEEAEGRGWGRCGGVRRGGGGKEIKTGVLLVPPNRVYTFYFVEHI